MGAHIRGIGTAEKSWRVFSAGHRVRVSRSYSLTSALRSVRLRTVVAFAVRNADLGLDHTRFVACPEYLLVLIFGPLLQMFMGSFAQFQLYARDQVLRAGLTRL